MIQLALWTNALEIQNALSYLRTVALACDARNDQQSVTYLGIVSGLLRRRLDEDPHHEYCDVNDPIIKKKPCNCRDRVPHDTLAPVNWAQALDIIGQLIEVDTVEGDEHAAQWINEGRKFFEEHAADEIECLQQRYDALLARVASMDAELNQAADQCADYARQLRAVVPPPASINQLIDDLTGAAREIEAHPGAWEVERLDKARDALRRAFGTGVPPSVTQPVAWRKFIEDAYERHPRYIFKEDTDIGAAQGWEPLYTQPAKPPFDARKDALLRAVNRSSNPIYTILLELYK